MSAADGVLNGRYRLDRPIGRGGFARVFLAMDVRLKRQVAVKVLNADLVELGPEHDFLARFEREAQAVAALDHPNILGIYDYGESDGAVYLVMPYIAGGSLHDKLRTEGRAGLQQAGAYLRQAAAALDYAHRRNLVHRDVKPQNMLLRAEDDRLLLADFGIAKVLGDTSAHSRSATVGTLSYIAPEQIQGRAGRATDVYALGCVLFQLLTGELPYTGSTEQVLYAHLMGPIPALAERGQDRLPAALQAIIDRALAKSPDARFASAGELADAFEAALTGDAAATNLQSLAPVRGAAGYGPAAPETTALTAGPPVAPPGASRAEQAGGVTRETAGVHAPAAAGQHVSAGLAPPIGGQGNDSPPALPFRPAPALLGGLGALLAVLLLVAVAAGVLAATRRQGDPTATAASTAGGLVTDATTTIAPATLAPATAAPTVTVPPTAVPAVPTQPPATGPPLRGQNIATFPGHTDHARSVSWAPDGQALASSSGDGSVRLWSLDGAALATFSGRTFAVPSVAWSPDGRSLAVGSDDRKVHLWSASGDVRATLTAHTDNVVSVAWAPDSRTVASASWDRTVRLWTAEGRPLPTLAGHTDVVQAVAWSPDGTRLVSGSWDRTVRLWAADGRALATLAGHTDQVWGVAWSPDGKTIASASRDRTVRLWTADGRPLATLTGHTAFVSSVAWSPDSATLASGAFDNTVRLWTADGRALSTLTGHTDAVTGVAWSPDGRTLASSSWDRTVRLWR